MSTDASIENASTPLQGEITNANAPFDDPEADAVFRSSDHVDFHVFKRFLSLASPVFKDMFSLPQSSTDDWKDGLPVIPVTENSAVLCMLFTVCYPKWAADPPLEKMEEVASALEAAIKYDMQGVRDYLGGILVSPRFVEQEPVRAWAIASGLKMEKEVRIAAKYTLKVPMSERKYFPELEYTTAGEHQRLLEYYVACCKAAGAVGPKFAWNTRNTFVWFQCGNCSGSGLTIDNVYVSCRAWWKAYMDASAAAVASCPIGATAVAPELTSIALEGAYGCQTCRKRAFAEMQVWSTLYSAEIDRVVSKVTLEIGF